MDLHSQDSWQALIAILWPFAQQWITKSQAGIFSWITANSPAWLKSSLSALIALLATAGFHYSWNGTAAAGGVLTLAIPPMSVIGHVAGQWIIQHMVYQTAIKQPEVQKQLLDETRQIRVALQAQP